MGAIARGTKNTFRNGLRTTGFAVIIAVSMALAFSMLLANQAVKERGDQLKREIGSSLKVYPVGAADFSSSGVPFTEAEAAKLATIPNVKTVVWQTAFGAQNAKEREHAKQPGADEENLSGSGNQRTEISLASSLEWPVIPGRGDHVTKLPAIPISIEGTTGEFRMDGKKIRIKSGQELDQKAELQALIGEGLAQKNGLTLGSAFTLGGKTFTVRGLFKSETSSEENAVIIPFATASAILGKKHEIMQLIVTAKSVDEVGRVSASVKEIMGAKRADVASLQPEAARVVASLKGIERISFITLVIALGAAALTMLLTMVLVVRERKKEIGVLKAIGATNVKIVNQFLVESLILTLIGSVIGMGIAALTSNSILRGLISSEFRPKPSDPMAGGIVQQIGGSQTPTAEALVSGVTALIDWQFIAYGVGVAILIALVATALSALLTAKVRPAQIMRSN